MEEFDLLKERLQAITEKHRIQEDIRQKKQELDQEKLKLQHIKKKSLREQWLLQDSASHNAADSPRKRSLMSDQQQTRQLQLNIHRIEMEVGYLEREESMISTNESFIISRLKAVEKSSEDIIKEARGSLVPDTSQVATEIPDVPECLAPAANNLTNSEPDTPRKTLFAMEIHVSKNLSTGESMVLSTATVPAEELNQQSGLKVFDDGRKCVYSLSPLEGSNDQSHESQLSANEVEQLLRNATMHRQENLENYHQTHSRSEERRFYNDHKERQRVNGFDIGQQKGHHSNNFHRNYIMEKDLSYSEQWPRKPAVGHRFCHQESRYRSPEMRNNQNSLRQGHRLENHNSLGYYYGNQKDGTKSSITVKNCVNEASRHSNGYFRNNSKVKEVPANGRPLSRSHDQEVLYANQPQLGYTPANYIPLRDYVSVDEEELYCLSPPSYHSSDVYQPSTLCTRSAQSDRVPSPLYGDDTPYTILNAMDTTEPITAVFMGFQMAQDDTEEGQEYEGSLKAELVIIEDNDDDVHSMKEKTSNSYPKGGSANGSVERMQGAGDRRTEKRLGPGSERIHPSDT